MVHLSLPVTFVTLHSRVRLPIIPSYSSRKERGDVANRQTKEQDRIRNTDPLAVELTKKKSLACSPRHECHGNNARATIRLRRLKPQGTGNGQAPVPPVHSPEGLPEASVPCGSPRGE